MKKSRSLFVALIFCAGLSGISKPAKAQLWKNLQREVQSRAENRAVKDAGNATDAVLDETEKTANEAVKGKNKENDQKPVTDTAPVANTPSTSDYKNYDFVAGDKIIFQPDLSTEPDAELPARFTLNEGNAEIQNYEGEKILHLDKGSHEIVSPLMSTDHYLPEQFTVEFDMMYENDGDRFAYVNGFDVQFRGRGDNNYGNFPLYRLHIESNTKCNWGAYSAAILPFPEALSSSMTSNNTWHHVAIYIHKNIGKVYIDQYRVAASNTMPTGAGHLALSGDPHYGFKIKNFRLAAGGDDKYNKVVTDGRFVTHGILFDVNKSTIKPESMGALNEVVKMMKAHQDLKFEIDGHTDSDGNAEANITLSQQRADAVKAGLVKMGIDGNRLTTKGYGASKPMDSNDNAEGKANNRRVEFVKI